MKGVPVPYCSREECNGRTFETREEAKTHQQDMHGGEQGDDYVKRRRRGLAAEEGLNEKDVSVAVCGECGAKMEATSKTDKGHKSDVEKNMATHMKIHNPDAEKFPCTVLEEDGVRCPHKATSQGNLNVHIQRVHTAPEQRDEAYQHMCGVETCGGNTPAGSFPTKQNLERHNYSVHGVGGVKCEQCEARFRDKNDMKNHMKRNH